MSKPPARSDAEAEDRPPPETAVIVDTRGHRCPTPTLRLRRALAAASPGARIVLLADDPLARIDVPHFLASEGYPPALISDVGGALHITVQNQRDRDSFGKVFTAIP